MPYVPHLLAYQFEVGETQLYRQTTVSVLDDPEAGRLTGRIVHELDYLVVADSPHGGWEIRLTRRLVEKEGPLVEALPDGGQDSVIQFRMTSEGNLYDLGTGLPGRKPQFPTVPVGAGDRWNSLETVGRGGLPPLTLTHQIVLMEQKEGEWQAGLSVMGDAVQTQEGQEVKVTFLGSVTFSVDRGKILAANGKVEMEWPNQAPDNEAPRRRRSQSAVELELRG